MKTFQKILQTAHASREMINNAFQSLRAYNYLLNLKMIFWVITLAFVSKAWSLDYTLPFQFM